MKIFIIQSGTYNVDGSLQYSITSKRQVESLIDRKIEVKVGLVTDRMSIGGIKKNIKRLKKEVNDFNPDLVHVHYGSVVGWIGWLVSREKRPFLVSFCGDDLLGSINAGMVWKIRQYISQKLSLYTARKSNHIFVKSQNLFEALPKKMKLKTSIVPNGVNSNFFRPTQNINELRNKLNWNLKEFIIFFNASEGANQKVKNIELARATLLELKKMKMNARLEEVSNLKAYEFRDRMISSNCLLVTSFHEGSPNVVKEALASNLPVVSVNCGDVAIRLKNVNIGGIYPYNANKLAKGLKEVSDFNGIFNGRDEFFKQELSDKDVAENIVNVYKKLF